MKQNLLPSLKTLWPLLSLTLFFQTACDSNQIIAQKGTKDTKPVDQKEIKSPSTPTVALTFEELIEEFKQQGVDKKGKEKTNHEEVLKALGEVKDDHGSINKDKAVCLRFYSQNTPADVLSGALLTGASPQLLQELVGLGAKIKDSDHIGDIARYAPYQSIKWLIDQRKTISQDQFFSNSRIIYGLWRNSRIRDKEMKELIIAVINLKVVDIQEYRYVDDNNLLGYIAATSYIEERKKLVTFLFSDAFKGAKIKELLYMENIEERTPYEEAVFYTKKEAYDPYEDATLATAAAEEIAELFKNAMDPDRYTIKVSGERGRKISDVLRQ